MHVQGEPLTHIATLIEDSLKNEKLFSRSKKIFDKINFDIFNIINVAEINPLHWVYRVHIFL